MPQGIVERLLLFLDSGAEHLVAETLIQMKDLLRRYPDMAMVSPRVNAVARAATVKLPCVCQIRYTVY